MHLLYTYSAHFLIVSCNVVFRFSSGVTAFQAERNKAGAVDVRILAECAFPGSVECLDGPPDPLHAFLYDLHGRGEREPQMNV